MRHASALRELCIEQNWFTSGSMNQYEKLFETYLDGSSVEEISLIIWVCSANVTREGVMNILLDSNVSFEKCGKGFSDNTANKPFAMSALENIQSVKLDVFEEDGSKEDILDDLKSSIISGITCMIKLMGNK